MDTPATKKTANGRSGEFHHEEDTWDQRKVMKNLLVISTAFFFMFTAFMGLSNLQSSINCDEGLGVASLATIYATLIFSALFMPSIVIRYLGLKWTLVASQSCYTLYMVANFYPSWWTLIPASVLVGLGAAPMWSAKCTYLTTIGMRYAELIGESRDVIVSRFFGIFFLFFQSSQVMGNLISSLIFSQEADDTSNDTVAEPGYECGSMYCYTDSGNENVNVTSPCEANKPDPALTNIVIATYTACGVVAMLIVTFGCDHCQPSEENQSSGPKELLSATLRLMKGKRLILLIPITIYSGLEQAFIQGDFTKSYVTCKIGVQFVGYVMICYGVVDAVSSYLSGRFEKFTGRQFQFSLGAIVHVALVIAMVVWKPTDEMPIYFVLAGLWGLGDAIWQTQINAYYGVLFPFQQEPAFSNYRLWESLGFTVSFAYSNFLCIWTKLIILTTVLGFGMTGYFLSEFDRAGEDDEAKLVVDGDGKAQVQGIQNFGMEISSPDGEKLQVTHDMKSFKE